MRRSRRHVSEIKKGGERETLIQMHFLVGRFLDNAAHVLRNWKEARKRACSVFEFDSVGRLYEKDRLMPVRSISCADNVDYGPAENSDLLDT